MKTRFVSVVVVVGVALVACSSSSSTSSSPAATTSGTDAGRTTPASQTIGAAGGTVTAAGVTLTIPAGALPGNTTISITPDASPIPAQYTGLSPLFAFGPDGTKFATPATISFNTSSAGTRPTVYWSNDSGGYDALATTVASGSVSASVLHFSTGFAANRLPDEILDAGVSSDSGVVANPDGGAPISGISVMIDGVVTTFATNQKVTVGTATTIQADDNATTTHWTFQIAMTSAPSQTCPLNGNPTINYSHYTAGSLDQLYTTKEASVGNCVLTNTNNPVNPGDKSTGTFSGQLGKNEGASGDAATHTLASGTFDLTL